MPFDFSKEVARGAQVLDTNFPGWEQYIDMGQLDIRNHSTCLLAQLGSKHPNLAPKVTAELGRREQNPSEPTTLFDTAWDTVFVDLIDDETVITHGFTLDHANDEHMQDDDAPYEALTQEWKDLIGGRRSGKAAQVAAVAAE